jgi:hypothetical protein
MQIAIVLYPRLTALDAIGPYEVLRLLPDTQERFVGTEPGRSSPTVGIALVFALAVGFAAPATVGYATGRLLVRGKDRSFLAGQGTLGLCALLLMARWATPASQNTIGCLTACLAHTAQPPCSTSLG